MTPGQRIDAIVVPLDGSEFSARALPVSARLATRLDAEIVLLSAVDDEDERERREKELEAVEIPVPSAGRSVVIDRDPAGAIHEALRRFAPAVACMATHGRGRSAALVGSVATGVVARGRDPLVLVGPMVGERPLGDCVVACVDDTPASVALVPLALHWARMLREPLKVLTVAEPGPPSPRKGTVLRAFGPDGDVKAFLEALVAPVRAEGVVVETVDVYDPVSPADGVRMYLDEHHAFLLAVSSHARTGVARLVLGSTAAAIVHHSFSPVLVVPQSDSR